MKILDPASYNEAKNHSCWVTTMTKEIEALEANDTWDIMDLPKGKNYRVRSKWVYKAKLDEDGNLDKLKGRVVAIGYQQVAGKDYKNTFSTVAELSIVRIAIALATVKGWPYVKLTLITHSSMGTLTKNFT